MSRAANAAIDQTRNCMAPMQWQGVFAGVGIERRLSGIAIPADVLFVQIWIDAVRQIVKPLDVLTGELIEVVATTRPWHGGHLSQGRFVPPLHLRQKRDLVPSISIGVAGHSQ